MNRGESITFKLKTREEDGAYFFPQNNSIQESVINQINDKDIFVTAEQIHSEIKNIEILTEIREDQLEKLLLKYKEVFSNKAGFHKSYVSQLKLKEVTI